MSDSSESYVAVTRGSELNVTDQTAGMDRQKAFETENTMVFQLQVEGNSVSGWHHHGDHHVFGYLVEGEGRWEYGEGDEDTVAIEAGDFWHIPPRTIHRDINPADERQRAIVTIVGSGPLAIDVEGPDAEVIVK